MDAARRELLEETGYEAGKLEAIGKLSPNPAVNTNTIHYYKATELVYKGQKTDEDEVIDVRLMSIDSFEKADLNKQNIP